MKYSPGRGTIAIFASAAVAFVVAGTGQADAEPGPDGSYYGSRAISVDSTDAPTAVAFNYPNWAESDVDALATCRRKGGSNCEIIVRFVDGCGAIAERDGRYRRNTFRANQFPKNWMPCTPAMMINVATRVTCQSNR
ncbi:DUF4189 domain-containing protein [Nocardia brasiliensis]|uniref:DUF4189 domain-containing protein n=1 Tax=Nocardia brasiliensis TaxID=37326 RepID=UPI003671A0A8